MSWFASCFVGGVFWQWFVVCGVNVEVVVVVVVAYETVQRSGFVSELVSCFVLWRRSS